MKLIKCNKGHFYDSDSYPSCPYCNSAGSASAGDSVTIAANSNLAASDVTVSMPSSNLSADPVTMMRSDPVDPVTQKSIQAAPAQDFSADIDDFSSIVQGSVLPSDDAVTQSHYQPIMENFVDEPIAIEPVVGWLVCISGQYFGKSFPLKAGRNFIGRSMQMDVCLNGEKSVSRDRHAVIIYEPRGRMFLAQPGDSRELFYLNDKVVLDNEKLNPYDVVSVGKVDMMLIPFCTEKFAWEDLEKKKEAKKNKDVKKKMSGINLDKRTEES